MAEAKRLGLVGIIGGRAQSLAGIPIILAIALSQSVVPIISAAYSRKDMKQVGHQTTRVLQLSILSGLPAVLVIAIAARPLDFFMFGHEDTAYGMSHGPHMISLLTLGAMFQIVMQTSGAVLMGMGRMKPLMTACCRWYCGQASRELLAGAVVRHLWHYRSRQVFALSPCLGSICDRCAKK